MIRNEKPCSFYKIEHSSTDPQSCPQMSSNILCQFLALNSHRVVEIQVDLSVSCNKKENGTWSVTRNEKTLALKIKLNTHQRI